MVRFAHLHCHSHYSLLEASTRVDELVDAAVACGQDRIALTDHGNLFAAIEFYKAARAKNVTPILGCEIYVAARDAKVKDAKEPVYHLTVLAETLEGYHNLVKLVSSGWLEGFYHVPRVDKAKLAAHSKGLIALSGCMQGEVSRKLMARDMAGAERVTGELCDLFGKDSFFLEVMENGIAVQRRQRDALLELAEKTGVPTVLTNDVHYLKSEHAAAREVMMNIASNRTFKDENRWRLDTDQQHFRTSEEMASLFKGAAPLAERAYEVASRCNVKLPLGEFHLPRFDVPGGVDPNDYFRRACESGVARRYGEITDPIRKRLDYEIEVIREMGFVSYFLTVADFVSHAREHGIPVGPGRGSAAGSIVSYSLGITDVDPLRYDLLFERFLNRGRISMPDIDIDFCRDRRGEVIRYVQSKYGHENVCQIVTFGTLAARAALRDAGRVLGVDLMKVDRITKKIPGMPGTELSPTIEADQELKDLRAADPEVAQLFDISLRIEGLNRHTSTHAAGVVITDRSLVEYVPLCRVQNEVNTQYSMNDLESIGLLKMDFLGLKTLTVLDRAERLVNAARAGRKDAPKIDLATIPLDDPKTYELLRRGETVGVFQLESSGMRELLQKMKPDVFEDIVAILALYRPGPLGSGMVDSFVNRKHGVEPIEYPHPALEPILSETYGVMVYQEQVMRIANVLAGFSLEEADNLRKAMGKKKQDVMDAFQAKFVAGATKNGVAEKTAASIWEQMAYFAGYGFNKSHTVAYGILTYRTAWLKANYPSEYYTACLSVDRGDTDKIAIFLDDCRRTGIGVLGPDLNRSDLDFAIEDSAIRFGLAAIKGVGEKAVETLLAARRKLGRPFHSIVEVFEEVDSTQVNRAVWEAFVAAGALDWTGEPRARLVANLDLLLRIGQTVQQDRRSGQLGLFGAKQKGAGESHRVKLEPTPEWAPRERAQREKDALGFYLTENPLARCARTLSRFASHPLQDLRLLEGKTEVQVGGMVNGLRVRVAKTGRNAGQKFAMFRIAGTDGIGVDAVCFPEEYRSIAELLVDDAIGLFAGVIDTSREEVSLRVARFEPVEQVLKRRIDRVVVTLAPGADEQMLKLRDAIRAHAGEVPVYLRFPRQDGGEELVRTGAKFRIDVSEQALDALAEVVGVENLICR